MKKSVLCFFQKSQQQIKTKLSSFVIFLSEHRKQIITKQTNKMKFSVLLFFVLGSILVLTEARPMPDPGLLGSYPPEKAGCFVAGEAIHFSFDIII